MIKFINAKSDVTLDDSINILNSLQQQLNLHESLMKKVKKKDEREAKEKQIQEIKKKMVVA